MFVLTPLFTCKIVQSVRVYLFVCACVKRLCMCRKATPVLCPSLVSLNVHMALDKAPKITFIDLEMHMHAFCTWVRFVIQRCCFSAMQDRALMQLSRNSFIRFCSSIDVRFGMLCGGAMSHLDPILLRLSPALQGGCVLICVRLVFA